MRKVLITGGAGFIGSNFVLHIRKTHPADRLIVLDKLTYAGNLENLKSLQEGPLYRFVKGDINDAAFVDSLFADEGIDTVVNFAAEDRKSTRLNSSHQIISYAVFCLKKKKK